MGSDQSASLEPIGLHGIVRDIRIIESSMGAGFKTLMSRKAYNKKLRRVTDY